MFAEVAVGRRLLNLFYEEPDGDRWLSFDRYPRRIIRRLVRGRAQPSGQTLIFLNLCAGLDRIGVRYRVNDYRHAKNNPRELACIIGKSFVLDKLEWKNPILAGAALTTHPIDDPYLPDRLPIKKILMPGPWARDMCTQYWGACVEAWPVGIDTVLWQPPAAENKTVDVLLYDKVRWEHDLHDSTLIEPIRATLNKYGHSFREIRYGHYNEEEFHAALCECKTMVFLCEHETQGIAYQQALSCGVPIMAWDRGGPWQDPNYFPHRIVFESVTSVPYWDERCGQRFVDFAEFETKWARFWEGMQLNRFNPRQFIFENLTLEKCAQDYLEIVQSLERAT
jgi:hypothetical protein